MATFTVNRDVNVQIGPFALNIDAGVTQSVPDDLYDEVEAIIEATPGVTVTFGSYDRDSQGGGAAEIHGIVSSTHSASGLTAGHVIRATGATDYGFGQIGAASISGVFSSVLSGTVPTANLGSGSADSTKFLRGDQAWQVVTSGTTDHGSLGGLGDFDHDQYARSTHGGYEIYSTISSSGASATVDVSVANIFNIKLTAATVSLVLTGATSTRASGIILLLQQDATGSRTVSWPASVTWAGGNAPTLETDANAFDAVTLISTDGGSTWFGSYAAGTPTASTTFVGAKAYNSSTQNVNGTTAALTLNSEEFDTDGFHSTGSNTSRMTIPTGKGGKYMLAGGTFASGAGNWIAFRVDGSTYVRGGQQVGAAGRKALTAIASLTEGQYVELMADTTGAGSIDFGHASALDAQTWFAVTYLGA